MIGAEWNEREVPRALDCVGESALVLGANAGLPPGLYSPSVGHVTAEALRVLVVDVLDVVNAEPADLPAAVVPGPAAAPEASAAGPSPTWTSAALAGPACSRPGSRRT